MDFSDLKNDLFAKWQYRILNVCWWGTIIIALFELVVFIAFFKTGFLSRPVPVYLFERFVLPSGINLVSLFFCTVSLKSNRYTIVQKNLIVCITAWIVSSIVAIFHNYFKFLLVMNGIPIIITAIFADRKLLKRILYLCLVSFILSSVVMYFDNNPMTHVDFITTIICELIFLAFTDKISYIIVISQSMQIDFIYNQNLRQTELIQELKIEPLTKLYNRAAFSGALRSFIRKYGEQLINPHLVLLDLDHFKAINDTYGHANGDAVLIELAAVIKKDMGGIRRAFRYGGEEFVLLFENEDTNEVIQVVEQIRKDFSLIRFEFAPEKSFTLSAGIARIKKNQDAYAWFNSADSAMYRAKEAGRNRIEIENETLLVE
jgi:diguanylate cyclase (GGDEF)-like protein